jgi:hypothetical protein
MSKGVVPLSDEINRLKRKIDDLEWEGRDVTILECTLEHLERLQDQGEVWYPTF